MENTVTTPENKTVTPFEILQHLYAAEKLVRDQRFALVSVTSDCTDESLSDIEQYARHIVRQAQEILSTAEAAREIRKVEI